MFEGFVMSAKFVKEFLEKIGYEGSKENIHYKIHKIPFWD